MTNEPDYKELYFQARAILETAAIRHSDYMTGFFKMICRKVDALDKQAGYGNGSKEWRLITQDKETDRIISTVELDDDQALVACYQFDLKELNGFQQSNEWYVWTLEALPS